MGKENIVNSIKTGAKYLVVAAIGFGAGGFLGYEYGKTESTASPLTQGLEQQINSLEKEVNKLKATITGLEEEASSSATNVGALTYPNELSTANVSPEPLETGKAMKIANTAVTPSTTPTHSAPTINDVAQPIEAAPQDDHITAMDTKNDLHTPRVSEVHHNYNAAIPAASDMSAEIANQASASGTNSGLYRVQLSSFKHQKDAQVMQQKLQNLGIMSTLRDAQVNGHTWYRVQVGPYASMAEARAAKSNLRSSIKSDMLIVKSSQ